MKEYKDSEEIKRQLRIWIQDCEDWLEQKEADCFRDCIDLLDEIPTADVVEVRHGRWEYVTRRYEAWTHRCSECGEIMTTQIGRQANYCHNCGAKMDKEE